LKKGLDKAPFPCYNTNRKREREDKTMTKQAMVNELKKLDTELDQLFARKEALEEEYIERFGINEWNKLCDILQWT
jgi:hypothetical protein